MTVALPPIAPAPIAPVQRTDSASMQLPPVAVKTLQAATLTKATTLLQKDIAAAWADGYAVTSQSWEAGGRSVAGNICIVLAVVWVLGAVGFFTLAPIASLLQIGLAILFYYIGIRSKSLGTLSITFTRQR